VIAREWRGKVRTADAEEYLAYVKKTGMAEYRACAGNRGAWLMRRDLGDETTEIVTLSFWDSRESIREFAGDDIERAVFYPEDDRFLVERPDGDPLRGRRRRVGRRTQAPMP
jgi:heme-degrading monooxygenase HmoA